MKKVTPYGDDRTKKEQVESMFDSIAKRYDFLNHLMTFGIDYTWRKRVNKLIRKHPHGNVLDIATGTGDLALAAAKIPHCHVTGLDLSQQMLDVAEIKAQKNKLSVKFIKGDAENLPFDDNHFDIITAAFGVRNFENLDKGLKEMARVLKKDGVMIILECSQSDNKLIRGLFNIYFRNILPVLGRLISKDNRAYTYLPESVGQFPYGNEMKRIMEHCGMQNVSLKKLTLDSATIYIGYK